MNRRINLLIVEDREDTAEAIKKAIEFKDSRIRSEIVPDLRSALARLKRGGIQAVLCDLLLPDAKGVEAIATIHHEFRSIPLIAMTGVGGDDILERSIRAGAGDFLEKGTIPGELLVMSIRKDVIRKEMESRYAEYWESRKDTEEAISRAEETGESIHGPSPSSIHPTKLSRHEDTATEDDVKDK